MEREKFVKLVIKEIETIKKKATNEEIARLNFNVFDASRIDRCIYGQMTGNCDSARALKLMPKKYDEIGFNDSSAYSKDYIQFEVQDFTKGNYFTALEKYLFMVKAPVHRHIISYLKGRTKVLKIK